MSNFLLGISNMLLYNSIVLITLLVHILSDFQFQSEKIASLKTTKLIYLLKHLIIVGLPLIVLVIISPINIMYFLLVWLSHVIIDSTKYSLNTYINKNKLGRITFIIDQTLHIFCIVYLYYLVGFNDEKLNSVGNILRLILFFAILGKPVNIIFKILFSKYQVVENNSGTIAGAGAIIGIIERYIIGICVLLGQYASIGLIFAAKSVARYNKISENQSFAEYYLIGSLFSIICVLVTHVVLFML
ncbi:hypothetical protein HMPREF1983_00430 [Gemella bergeri ATCC 700627]|uniref:DUF3307 domain-containing protein n=1 Tax=Gemella bergeri ATCC 700627 TaxID=1321820 RepID=U2QUD5_9BACL|nr:DUF3307 domain-containing protein [Gemella bergeri]ERK59829.1 hypothetical protein HMPREF1983_00430 [Gemella bergeri ATCC 700627]